MAICVLVIPWIVGKAEVVRSTTMVSVAFSAYYTWYKEKIYQQLFFEIDVGTVFSVFCQLAKLIDIGTFYVHELFWMLQRNRDDNLLFEP